jgi:hypothetical protein
MANPANRCPNVCFWHKADVQTALMNVRFWGNNGHDAGGDHGKLLDTQAEPMCYRQTRAMDGAFALFPDGFDD